MTGSDNEKAIVNRSYGLLQSGQHAEALDELRRASARLPASIPIRLAIANVLLAGGRIDESIECALEILVDRPGLESVRNNLANLLHRKGRFREAVEQYDRLIEGSPGNAELHYRRGVVLQDLGLREDALAAFREAVAIDVRFVRAWHAIAEASRRPFDDTDAKALLALQSAGTASVTDRIRLGFALGRHFERSGRPDAAAQQFIGANALQRDRLDYDIRNDLRAMDNIRAFFDSDFFDDWQAHGAPDSRPVFIVGMPRSGTTLVEQILASHSQVFGAGEISLLVDSILETFPISNGTDYTESLAGATVDRLRRVAQRYLDGLPTVDTLHVTDKLPHNFLNIGMIHVLFPRAAIVHCRRDARDTCFSIWKHLFGSDAHAYAYHQEELARYYKGYSALMQHWDSVLPDRIHHVRYEALVGQQELTTRELLDACSLDWEPACLEFHTLDRPVATLSASQVRQPVYSGSIGAWKPYADALEPLFANLD